MNPSLDPSEPRVRLESRDGHAVVVLVGEIGIALAGELRSACVEASDLATDVALDWRDLAHLDASALQVLIALRERVHEQGHRLRAEPPPARVADLLALAGFRDGLVDRQAASGEALAAPSTA
ncbi:MAG: STAS domain-containing protein [Deltaproteobacteria bacterium]|jgi:anti-anti-sigma factor|nr:STAS domain-containing protein [Deltaproteobacteria bacterium]